MKENQDLTNYNSFGLSASAKYFAEIVDIKQLFALADSPFWEEKLLILGGGSNVLLLDDFDGLLLHIATKGISVVEETKNEVMVKVAAGENWHQFVLHALSNQWFGIENLSLIPGSVGASPMQNIGAYGVEIEQVFSHLEAFHIQEKEIHTFTKEQCEFGYRSSIFKTKEKNNYIITNVYFTLSKQPNVNVSYGAIQSTLEEMGIDNPTPKDVSDAVIAIRQRKLPDPKLLGNSGSFFKNPVVTKAQFAQVFEQHPDMPHYIIDEKTVKIPAGWLIDQCGLKGVVHGNTGTYKNQALILVNHGGATGQEIWEFANSIQQKVNDQFSIMLEPEVNLVQ